MYTDGKSNAYTVLIFLIFQVLTTIIFMNYRHNIWEMQAVINACLPFWLAPSAGSGRVIEIQEGNLQSSGSFKETYQNTI